MENKKSCEQLETQEIVVLLRSLRVEATPEAHFEERFLYDFRERLVQEAVCRPARILLWEHLVHCLRNICRRRRLIWGASSFSLGMLCLGVFTWPHSSGSPRLVVASYDVQDDSKCQFMAAGVSADEGVRTTVRRRPKNRMHYSLSVADSSLAENLPSYLASGVDDDLDSMPFDTDILKIGGSEDSFPLPDMMLHTAY